MMNILLIAGILCFAVSLFLPAFKSTGFLAIGGTGWKILFLSIVLMIMGFSSLLKETNSKFIFYFLPGLLNIFIVLLMILGLFSVQGPAMRTLGVCTFICWTIILASMIFKMKSDLKIGAYFWCASGLLLAINGMRS